MPNAAQTATYEFIRSEIARLRGPHSHTPLTLDEVSPLADDRGNAIFRVNGARVLIRPSGKVTDSGLPDCPTYACGLALEENYDRSNSPKDCRDSRIGQ
jgi:hypothetical protein